MEKAIMDSICILADGTPEYKSTDDEFWRGYNIKKNHNIEMYYGLYKSGELKKIAEYYNEYNLKEEPDVKIVDFVISPEKLTEEFITRMNKKYPKNSLNEIPDMQRCTYTHCIGLVLRCFDTYRDIDGCVGKSFEHPLVTTFSSKDCFELYDIAAEQGPVQSAIELFRRW